MSVVGQQGALAMRPFTESLPMALVRARESTMRLFRPHLAAFDLTEQQWRVLRTLAASGAALDVGELAEHTFLLAPSLSRILANLETRGLTQRVTAERDQRRSLISLTLDGSDLVAKVAPRSEAMYLAIEERFGAQRLRCLLDELHDLAALDIQVPRVG
jgi:homoprotocatechuate degradation regulator HpaR